MQGRKPVPTAIKELRGTSRPDRANPAEPHFDVPSRVPSPPDYLDDTAASIWRDLGKMLLDAGLFTKVDKYALGMFCAAAGRWMEAERSIKKTGTVLRSKTTGNYYHNPFLSVANKSWDQMYRMFGQLGLTPAERTRIKAIVPEQGASLADVLFELAGGEA